MLNSAYTLCRTPQYASFIFIHCIVKLIDGAGGTWYVPKELCIAVIVLLTSCKLVKALAMKPVCRLGLRRMGFPWGEMCTVIAPWCTCFLGLDSLP
jgi:hypothetical protein